MRREHLAHYRCPYTGESLRIVEESQGSSDELIAGVLESATGTLRYAVCDGVPHFVHRERQALNALEAAEHRFYEERASEYDSGNAWLFRSFGCDQAALRDAMVAALRLPAAPCVLEVGCGTGLDTVRLQRSIGPRGVLFAQDFSPTMLALARERVAETPSPGVELHVGHAAHLPFPDGFFDAVFTFGGFNVFTDSRMCLHELTRVVRPGGRVLVGDEGLAPWLLETEYGRILQTAHPLYGSQPPLTVLPVHAHEVRLEWVLGNAFYVLTFTVGDSPPAVDLDLAIPGFRGGTLRTRYFGSVEGVRPETRARAIEAALRAGTSLHEWLDAVIDAAARRRDE